MKTRNRSMLMAGALLATLLVSTSALACDGMGPSAHMGQLMSVDAAGHTFTIRDAQSSSAITFAANDEIINGLKGYAGSLMVNYQETDDGGLKAVGVTF